MATAKMANQLPCGEVVGRALEIEDWSIGNPYLAKFGVNKGNLLIN
jgi:hypothetical protein